MLLIFSNITTYFRKTEYMSSWMDSTIGLTKFEVMFYRCNRFLRLNKCTLMFIGKLFDRWS